VILLFYKAQKYKEEMKMGNENCVNNC